MKYSHTILVIILIIVFSSCIKDKITTPELITFSPENITASTATSGRSIINDGGAAVTSSGVCWSTSAKPTIDDNKSDDGSEIGKFSDLEWITLTDYLITNGFGTAGPNNHLAQTLAASSDWARYGVPASAGNDLSVNNSSGFSGLPTGFLNANGHFQSMGEVAYYWSSTESKPGANFALQREIYYAESGFYTNEWGTKSTAVSVRCIKNF